MTIAEITRKMVACSKGNVENSLERVFRTETGRELFRSLYL